MRHCWYQYIWVYAVTNRILDHLRATIAVLSSNTTIAASCIRRWAAIHPKKLSQPRGSPHFAVLNLC